jgi:hypothetical protein
MPPRALPAARSPEPAPPKREVPPKPGLVTVGPVHPMAVVEPSPEPVEVFGGPRPWERQSRETDAAWALFLAFRDSAYPDGPSGRYVPRNLPPLAEALGIGLRYLRDLSASFHWFIRAGAFDRALDAARAEADISEVKRTRLRHTRLVSKARLALEGELDKWLSRSTDPDISSMSPKEVMGGLELVVKLERLLVGEHTDHVKVEDGSWDLEAMSLEDLQALEGLRRKARGGG